MAAITTLNPVDIRDYRTPQNQGDITARRQGRTPQVEVPQSGSNRSVSMAVESYKSESLYMEYTSKDGDKAVLSYKNVEYQKAQIQIDAGSGTSDEDWKKIVDQIMEDYKSLRSEMLKRFFGDSTGDSDGTDKVKPTANIQAAAVPEYWNAENTSQRILDFATQFLDAFKGSGEEFLAKIRNAIKEGFQMAHKELGDLPDSVNKLVQDTFDLTMKKLDAWAQEKGISVDDGQGDDAQPVVWNRTQDALSGVDA